ncbi:lipopolysaccharide biosynthesis protein [Costertonia aggregata]|uniref:Oligosaccharide flippase family protein n=1 Tax=Costertonia aggregata TaxID=343403 RepID=A0A7H9AT99_9FLAO|nr:oligosaccharide flippase family protein [Costertonia aggregata]QLG46703.1 oligosaccharide flippase family protein [Costertonia aggregata]
MSQLKKGAFLNYTTIILTNVVGLFLTPFIIKQLGDAEYGLYTLIGAFVGYIAVLDFGLTNTVVRFVAKYRAEKDKEGEENFLATTMIIYAVISTLVIIVGTICYFNIDSIFENSLNPKQMESAKIMFAILIVSLAIVLPAGVFDGVCFGYEKFVFPKMTKIIRYVLRSLLVVGVLLLGGDAVSMVILDVSLNVIFITIMMVYVFRNLKVKFKLHDFNKRLLRKIFGYSIWIFIFVLVGQFQWRVGQMVLGIVANPVTVAIFAVGVMLGTYYGAFSTAISGVFLPRATQMTVHNATPEQLTDMMIKIGRLSFIALMYILGAFLLYGKQFVYLWVGESYHNSWLIALIIMFAYTLPLVQGFGNSILEARNKLSFKAIIYLVFLILGTVLGGFLAKTYGAVGMISGSVAGWVVVQNVMNYYYHKVIQINILRFFKELLHKTLPVFVLTLIIGYAINMVPGQGWLNFIIKAVLYSAVYILLMFTLGTIRFEKQLMKKTLSPLFNKLKVNA